MCSGAGSARRMGRRGMAGFTLLEILIVVVIIGILAAIVGFKIGNRAMDDRLQNEADRFGQLVRLAQEETQVKGIPLGLRFTTSGYQFLGMDDKGVWVDYNNGVLHARRIEPPFFAELHVEGRMVPPEQDEKPGSDARDPKDEKKNKLQPQILLLPGGETTAFAVDMKAQKYPSWFHIESDALGRVRQERQYLQ
ncbi:MAG TPA: type II secretion system minor pseudopilin GspH [Nevskia sp.]|nr:type II secretion system minor pseudopilin GspH [Nevskia sp.]